LSQGGAGKLKGGDRLPWVGGSTDQDNFAPLSSLAWQVHVYGEAGSGLAELCKGLSLPLHTFAWSPKMRTAGFTRGALYLVRPDGYLALVEAGGKADGLAEYLDRRGLRLS
jgi:hypothetical protein